jgi:hypothetical protein
MHVEFARAVEAANRAVMADTDEASKAGADQARQSRDQVDRDLAALATLVRRLGYADDARLLDDFSTLFTEYAATDNEILPLAVENTNLKAQRLSFGDARKAVGEFRAALAADQGLPAVRAQIGILEILAVQAPHIASADDAAMSVMESEMSASERHVRAVLAQVNGGERALALAAFDRFMTINAEIVRLSRRNSNVRSLALALGTKQTLAAQCEAALRAIEQAIAGHGFRATR